MFPPVAMATQGIRELLAVGHREAFAWIDSWHGMSEDDVRKYEDEMRQHMYVVHSPFLVAKTLSDVSTDLRWHGRNAKISKTAKRAAEAEAKGEVQPIQPPPGNNVLRRMSTGGMVAVSMVNGWLGDSQGLQCRTLRAFRWPCFPYSAYAENSAVGNLYGSLSGSVSYLTGGQKDKT